MKKKLKERGFASCLCDGGSENVLNLVVNFSETKSKIVTKNLGKKRQKALQKAGKDIIADEPFLTLFEFIIIGKYSDNWSFLHQIDLECSQVGFDGQDVISTYAFLQSLTTQTIINYSLVNDYWAMQRTNAIERIDKYYHRGSTLLAPKAFDFTCLDTSDDTKKRLISKVIEELASQRKTDIKLIRKTYPTDFATGGAKRPEQIISNYDAVPDGLKEGKDWEYTYDVDGYGDRYKSGKRIFACDEPNSKVITDNNSLRSKTITGIANNDSMHVMPSFMQLVEVYLTTCPKPIATSAAAPLITAKLVPKKKKKKKKKTMNKKSRSKYDYSLEVKKGNSFWISRKDDCRTFKKVFYEFGCNPQSITDILRA
eukprot:119165_1